MVDQLQIFDSKGLVRRDFTDEEISALPEDQRAALFKMLSVYQQEVEAAQELADAEHALLEANRAQRKVLAERPRIDAHAVFLRELRAVISRPQA